MKLTLPKGKAIYCLIIAFFIFYAFNTAFQDYFYGSRQNGIILILIVTAIGVAYCLITKGIKPHMNIEYFWYLMAIFSIYNNQDLTHDSQSRWLLPMAGIALIFILKREICWYNSFVIVFRFMVMMHAFFTIFFYIFKGLYLNYFINIFPGSHTALLSWFNSGYMPGITTHYSTNGIYLGLGLILVMTDLIRIRSIKKENHAKVVFEFIFVFVALLLTAKRAHILFAMMAMIMMYYGYNSNHKISRVINIIGIIIVAALFVVALIPFVPTLQRVLGRFFESDISDLHGRTYFWKYAFAQFKTSPWIGIGWGGFKHRYFNVIGSYSSSSDLVDVHNVYIQLLCEQGIIGLALFMVAAFGTFFMTYKLLKELRTSKIPSSKQEQYLLTLSIGIQSFFLMYCMSGNCLYDCECFFVYIASCTLMYSLRYKIWRESNARKKSRVADVPSRIELRRGTPVLGA